MSEVEVVESTKVERLVTLEDGSVVNFGARANVLVHSDSETKVITFALSNGKKIVWTAPEVEGLTPFQVQVYLYGLAAKVKSSLAPLKDLADIEAAIEKQIASIDSGVFILKSNGREAVAKLTNLQKAYASVKATTEGFESWANVDAPEVIEEVLTRWAAFTVSERNSIRKNAYVKLALAPLEAAAAKEADLI